MKYKILRAGEMKDLERKVRVEIREGWVSSWRSFCLPWLRPRTLSSSNDKGGTKNERRKEANARRN